MNTEQLKLLAGHVRTLLEQNNSPISHSQSLDVIASLPGLRNWPEVVAFPKNVANCDLDLSSTRRLAFRLKSKFGLDFTSQFLLETLYPQNKETAENSPHVWPSGPKPGVYITYSQDAIDEFILQYDEATDGELYYHEKAGDHFDGGIDLGESGLWSGGIDHLPSGTLIVVGPLGFNQESWTESARRLEISCLHALSTGLRVAILIDSPTPQTICEDTLFMIRSTQPEGEDYDTALIGIITPDGQCHANSPFANKFESPLASKIEASIDLIPKNVLVPLRNAIKNRNTGLLLFGNSLIEEHHAIDLICASLSLTNHLGPVARVKPHDRASHEKEWNVPDAIKSIPYVPSIESAYAQGFKRIIFSPYYTQTELLIEYSKKALLISGTADGNVDRIFMTNSRTFRRNDEFEILELVVAILGLRTVPGKSSNSVISDLLIPEINESARSKYLGDIFQYLQECRIIKWENEIKSLLESKQTTSSALKKAFPNDHDLKGLLNQLSSKKNLIKT